MQTELSQSRPTSRKAADVDTCHSTCAGAYDRFTIEIGYSPIGDCDASSHRSKGAWTISLDTRVRLS